MLLPLFIVSAFIQIVSETAKARERKKILNMTFEEFVKQRRVNVLKRRKFTCP